MTRSEPAGRISAARPGPERISDRPGPISAARPAPGPISAARAHDAAGRPSAVRAGSGVAGRVDDAQFCRVTLLAPRSRMDLALPTDLTVAELVPMLCELAGESGGRGRGAGVPTGHPAAWCLAAVAGAELPSRATLAGLGVLDGDLLRLRRRAEAPPPPVFDDPVDAVAEVVPAPDGSPGPWGHADPGRRREPLAVLRWNTWCRRWAGLGAGAVTAVLAAALLAAARGLGSAASPMAAVIAGLAALAALALAARTVSQDPTAAAVLGAAAVPLAAATGFAALPGAPGAGHLLLAAALAAAAAAAALTVLSMPAPVLVGVALAAALTALAALLAAFDAGSTAGLAAGVSAAGIGLLPLLPKISARMAGLPAPVVPTTPEEMLAADAHWQLDSAEDVGYHARLAHVYLGGTVLGASMVAGGGAALAAAAGGTGGGIFASVVVAVLLLRSRAYATALASGAPLVAGLVAGTALVVGVGVAGQIPLRLAGGFGLLVAGSVAVALVCGGAEHEPSPVTSKAADVLEAVLVIATFPLALWVLDLFRAVQAL